MARVTGEQLTRAAILRELRWWRGQGMRWVVGIDEVGRGALAGPVTVGLWVWPISQELAVVTVRDSKTYSSFDARARALTNVARQCHGGKCWHTVVSESALMIDRCGIMQALRRATGRALRQLPVPRGEVVICADGGLPLPPTAAATYHIIRGDALVAAVAYASLVAKVWRDRLMVRAARVHPRWGFEQNRGYGTSTHLRALRRWGPSPIHRQSFLHSRHLAATKRVR